MSTLVDNIYDMELFDYSIVSLKDSYLKIVRVPGGWYFIHQGGNKNTSIFVPLTTEGMSSEQVAYDMLKRVVSKCVGCSDKLSCSTTGLKARDYMTQNGCEEFENE